MDPQVVDDKKSEEPDLKRQKVEEIDEKCKEVPSPGDSTCSLDSEDERLVNEEHKRNGNYDFDCTIQRSIVIFYAVKFENSEFTDEPETDGDLVNRLSKIALEKHNEHTFTNLEFVKAVKANWNGGGQTFYITFEAKDAANSPHTIPFQAAVRYFPWETKVYHVSPKP